MSRAGRPWLATHRLGGLAGGLLAALALAAGPLCPSPATAVEIKIRHAAGEKVATVELSGAIQAGDGLKVRAEIGKLPADVSIEARLNAAGGSLSEGMSIGRFFRQSGVRTVVPPGARCLTPCPLVLAGGFDRSTNSRAQVKHSTGQLGFSPFLASARERDYTRRDLDAAVASTQKSILSVADYLVEVGADVDLLAFIYEEIPAKSARYLADEEALALGIAVYDDKSGQLIRPVARRGGGP